MFSQPVIYPVHDAPQTIAFLSAIICWLGVAVTGPDTPSNSLFGALQVAAAWDAGSRPR